jgi:hypothetical protein
MWKPDALAETILRYLRDPEGARSMGERAKSVVVTLPWRGMESASVMLFEGF